MTRRYESVSVAIWERDEKDGLRNSLCLRVGSEMSRPCARLCTAPLCNDSSKIYLKCVKKKLYFLQFSH